MTRLASAFADARGCTGLVPYLTAGYPSLAASLELMRRFGDAGARAIELGVPFSDPIADGPVIQASYYRALERGFRVTQMFDMVKGLRAAGLKVPLPNDVPEAPSPIRNCNCPLLSQKSHLCI